MVSIAIPSQLKEGEFFTGNGKISLDRPADVSLSLSFKTNVEGRFYISGTVVPAGQTEKMFQIYSPDDSYIDGDVLVTVTASSPYTAPATAQVLVIDNENYNLSLDLPTVQEGGSVNASVVLSGVLRSELTVQITNPSPETLTMPASVTFPLQHVGILLPITAADNTVVDGSRSVLITAGTRLCPRIQEHHHLGQRADGLRGHSAG